MRVTVTHAGTEIMVDDADVKAIAEFVLALGKNGTAPANPKPKARPKRSHKKKPTVAPLPPQESVKVSSQLYEMWQVLVNSGSSSGLSYREAALDLNIKPATAMYRLTRMVKLGLAHKVGPGMYLSGETPSLRD